MSFSLPSLCSSNRRRRSAIVPLLRLFVALPILTGLIILPAHALVKLSSGNVNEAIKYGIRNKDLGLTTLLGPNWIENPDGSLLNIYSPFMMVATQAARKGVETTSKADMTLAKKRMARTISNMTDPNEVQRVKFVVALYGDHPGFNQQIKAHIEGTGRGRTISLTPNKEIIEKPGKDPNKSASGSANTAESENPAPASGNAPSGFGSVEAVNAYYFNFQDLENLEEFRLILDGPSGQTVFNINNENIY